ncbi:MAG: asparagine synthetase [Gammaproteobacteria bacterium]|nr:asparagine synthetase [Gammaproteobacteria bacterium]
MTRLALLLLLFWMLSACQTLSEKRQSALLVETLRKYEATLRWGSMQQSQSFASEEIAKFSPTRQKDIRIIHYEVVQGPTQVSEDKALQTVLIQYVHETSQSVRELLDQQVWSYDPETEQWTLQSPLPVFK